MTNRIERRIREIQELFALGLEVNDPHTYKVYKQELEELLNEQNKEIDLPDDY